jgi:hypothetical protein
MWWLLPLVGFGVVAAVLRLASNDERTAREAWEKQYAGSLREVQAQRARIEALQRAAQESYDFRYLNGVYFDSMRCADMAYSCLTNARGCLDGLAKMIRDTQERRAGLKQKFSSYLQRDQYDDTVANLQQLRELQLQLKGDFDKVLAEKRALSDEVARLNASTRALKELIRDRCGHRGQEWYEERQASARRRRSA